MSLNKLWSHGLLQELYRIKSKINAYYRILYCFISSLNTRVLIMLIIRLAGTCTLEWLHYIATVYYIHILYIKYITYQSLSITQWCTHFSMSVALIASWTCVTHPLPLSENISHIIKMHLLKASGSLQPRRLINWSWHRHDVLMKRWFMGFCVEHRGCAPAYTSRDNRVAEIKAEVKEILKSVDLNKIWMSFFKSSLHFFIQSVCDFSFFIDGY